MKALGTCYSPSYSITNCYSRTYWRTHINTGFLRVYTATTHSLNRTSKQTYTSVLRPSTRRPALPLVPPAAQRFPQRRFFRRPPPPTCRLSRSLCYAHVHRCSRSSVRTSNPYGQVQLKFTLHEIYFFYLFVATVFEK